MAVPAAMLAVVVHTRGIARAAKEVQGLHGDFDKTSRNASKAGDELEKTGKRGSKALGGLKLAAGALGGVAVFSGLAAGVKSAVGEFEEARKVGKLTESVIKSTGGAANVTAKQVGDLASSISKKAGVDDEAIQSGANLLLTFKNIRNETGKGRDIFNQTTQAAVDLSAAGFGDLTATSKQLGKALNDPVKGLTALGRSGVTFSEDQKKAIEALIATGKASDRVKAQQLILKEVNSQVGGAAAAQATSLDHLKVTMGNLAEAAGSVLVPAFDKGAMILAAFVGQMIEGRSTGGAVVSVFRTTGTTLGELVGTVVSVVRWFREHMTVTYALAAAVGVLLAAYAGFTIFYAVQAAILAVRAAMLALNASLLANPVVLVIAGLAALAAAFVVAYRESDTFRAIVDAAFKVIKTVVAAVLGWMVTAIPAAWNAIRNATTTVWGVISDVLTGVWSVLRTLAVTYFTAVRTVVTGVWSAIQTVTSTVWGAIREVASTAWSGLKGAAEFWWAGVQTAILTPVRAARDALGDIWRAIRETASDAWGKLKDGAGDFAKGLKNTIVDAFKDAANKVVDFVNAIIDVVNKIPGVDIAKIKGFAEGGRYKAQGFARGGAFARTRGLVTSPITLMGEEAPRHPEFVIPTNPAYRGRARGLLAQAAQTIGFAEGGRYSMTELVKLAQSAGMPNPGLMAAIAMAESGGNPAAHGPPDGRGLWQIEWPVWASTLGHIGNPYDPRANARMASEVLKRQGINAWVAYTNGSYKQFLTGKSQSVAGQVGGIVGDLLSKGAGVLLDKLPGVDGLPGWLHGMGRHVLDEVGGWIKSQVNGLIGGKDGGDFPLGTSTAGWEQINKLAKQFGNTVTSAFRPGDPGWHGKNRARDYAGGNMLEFARTLANLMGSRLLELIHTPLGFGIKNGRKVAPYATADHYNHVHVALAKGGMFGGMMPFVGSYKTGGTVPMDGLGYLHRGEQVVPRGEQVVPAGRVSGGVWVHVENLNVRDELDIESVAAKLAFKVAAA